MQYFFRYIEKVPSQKNLALAFGSAVHLTLQKNYSQKMQTKRDLPIDEIKDSFSDNYDTETADVSRKEIIDANTSEGSVKDNGIHLIKLYHQQISPRIQPTAVEQKLEASFKNFPTKLNGIVDLADVNGVVIDHKTTTRRQQMPEKYKIQVGIYKVLKQARGDQISDCRIDWLIRKANPEIVHVEVIPDVNFALRMFQMVCAGIEKEVFIPNRDSMLCTRRFCAYWPQCQAKVGGTVKD
jgi:RecB family exonuclease